MSHLPHYVEACAKYNPDYPLSANRNFVGLRAVLIVAKSNRPLAAPDPTAAPMGYAAATKAPSDVHEDIRSLQAQTAALLKATDGAKAAPECTFVMGPKPSTTTGHMECATTPAQAVHCHKGQTWRWWEHFGIMTGRGFTEFECFLFCRN